MAGDFHFPFECLIAVRLFLAFVAYFKPHIIFLNGDVADCWEISRFTKPENINIRLVEEFAKVRVFLYKLREVAPKARIIFIYGNHEYRFEKFIADNSKALQGLRGMTLAEQLCCDGANIEIVNSHLKENYFQYGKLLIGHFNKVNKHSAYTAKNLLEEKGISLIQNHTHRGGSSFKRDFGSFKSAYENFCMCNINPTYLSLPNWQQGFSVIHKDQASDHFLVTQLPIVKNKILYGNQFFK